MPQAAIHEQVLQFPDGYDTVVGERGLKLRCGGGGGAFCCMPLQGRQLSASPSRRAYSRPLPLPACARAAAARSSAWRWRAPSSSRRACCCAMRRRRRWTAARACVGVGGVERRYGGRDLFCAAPLPPCFASSHTPAHALSIAPHAARRRSLGRCSAWPRAARACWWRTACPQQRNATRLLCWRR